MSKGEDVNTQQLLEKRYLKRTDAGRKTESSMAGSGLVMERCAGRRKGGEVAAGPHLADGFQGSGGSSIGCSARLCFLTDSLESQGKML